MTSLEIWLLAVSVAMDCFSVSITSGIILRRTCWKTFITIGLFFGLFQAVMPLIGWCATNYFYHLIEQFDHWIAFGLLFFLGAKMIKESFGDEEDHHFDPTRFATLLMMAIATSIDALAVGISFACTGMTTWREILLPIVIIGFVSFAFSIAGCLLGVYFGKRINLRAELWAGVILIGIGVKILTEHLGWI
jgi:putative Mn2+ efflux pump MntP